MQALLWILERKWLSPLLTAALLFSGIFVVEDFAALKLRHPDWAGAISLINPTLFGILVVAGVSEFILAIGRAYLEPTMTTLKNDLGNAYSEIDQIGSAIRDVFDGMLYTFSKRLELSQSDQVRVSIYVHDEGRRRFIPCGRYSPNPKYTKPGRTHYPDDEGCIGKGWEHGWHFDNDFPPEKAARRRYDKDSYGLTRQVADGIKMQSRLYGVKRISHGDEALAVVVVESIEHDRFDQIALQTALDEHNDNIASMVKRLRKYIPDPGGAEAVGL